jgi:uncharacterized membrane protein YhdT
MLILKIFLIGWIILIGAILINVAAGALGLSTWYDFLKTAGQNGLGQAFQNTPWHHHLFLWVFYPALLGILAYACVRVIFKLV